MFELVMGMERGRGAVVPNYCGVRNIVRDMGCSHSSTLCAHESRCDYIAVKASRNMAMQRYCDGRGVWHSVALDKFGIGPGIWGVCKLNVFSLQEIGAVVL